MKQGIKLAPGINREFLCTWIQGNTVCKELVTFERLVTVKKDNDTKGDYEFIYALQDKIDKILDLPVGTVIPYQFNRDDKDSQGIIKRIH